MKKVVTFGEIMLCLAPQEHLRFLQAFRDYVATGWVDALYWSKCTQNQYPESN